MTSSHRLPYTPKGQIRALRNVVKLQTQQIRYAIKELEALAVAIIGPDPHEHYSPMNISRDLAMIAQALALTCVADSSVPALFHDRNPSLFPPVRPRQRKKS